MEIIESGYNVVIIDNLHNSSQEAIRRIEAIVGKQVPFENVDLTNLDAVRAVFAKYPISSVIHFAALKVRLHTSIIIDRRLLGKVHRSLWSIIESMLGGRST